MIENLTLIGRHGEFLLCWRDFTDLSEFDQ
jgi:hypothetical protein